MARTDVLRGNIEELWRLYWHMMLSVPVCCKNKRGKLVTVVKLCHECTHRRPKSQENPSSLTVCLEISIKLF